MTKLTKQEAHALRCAAEGLSSKATAFEMGLCVDTVKAHRASAFEKLNAKNVTHAVALALTAGLIELKEKK